MERHEEFIALLLRHETELRGLIGAFVPDAHEREDVFQEVAMTLWRKHGEYDPAQSFGGWTRGIAGNLILKNHSTKARRPLALSPDVLQTVLDAYGRTEERSHDRAEALRMCMEKLPERSREVLAMRYETQLKGPEIALRMGTTLDAANQILSRVRHALEECIRRRLARESSGDEGGVR